ncbi:MAG: DUF2085 domain-containing protein [Chloroflexota bacterium]
MTASEESFSYTSVTGERPFTRRRIFILLIGLGVLLLMAFYTITDAAHLAHSHVLNGADWAGYALCHRITERSFTIAGRQFPLCARCTGMYLGVFLVTGILWLNGRLRRGGLPTFPILLTLVGFVILMGIDGVNSYLHFFPNAPHLYEPRNWLRLLTGMGVGLMMGLIIVPALAQTLWRNVDYTPVITSLRELGGLIVVALVLILLLLSNQPALSYVLALASSAGLLFIVTALNVVFLLILFRRDGRAARWRETLVPLTMGLALAVLELGLIGLVRFNLTGTMTGLPGL